MYVYYKCKHVIVEIWKRENDLFCLGESCCFSKMQKKTKNNQFNYFYEECVAYVRAIFYNKIVKDRETCLSL